MHRLIMTSTVYRQSSQRDPKKDAVDVGNALLGQPLTHGKFARQDLFPEPGADGLGEGHPRQHPFGRNVHAQPSDSTCLADLTVRDGLLPFNYTPQ